VGRNNHINWLLELFNTISILSLVLIQIMLRVSASTEQRHLRLHAILKSGERNHFYFFSEYLFPKKTPKLPCFDLSCVCSREVLSFFCAVVVG
jgi:hypothetical protein